MAGDERERMLEMATRLRRKMTEANIPPKMVAGLEAVKTPENTMPPTESTKDAPAAIIIERRAFCCGCMAGGAAGGKCEGTRELVGPITLVVVVLN